jgi:hypothetical protein
MVLVRIEREIEIPDDFIEDAIIDPAGYGISYWADSAVIDDEARTYTVRERDPHDDNYGYNVISYDTLAQVLVDFAYNPVKYGVDGSDWVVWAQAAIHELEAGDPFPGGTLDSEIAEANRLLEEDI